MTPENDITLPEANAVQPSPVAAPAKRKLSVGEKIFDSVLYGPFNFFGTLISTAWIAHGLEYGFGKKTFDASKEWLLNKGMRPKGARNLLMTCTLFFGGSLMLIPIKVAESFKVPIVTKLNEGVGDKTDPSAIEDAPPQTWGSLITGRIVAWLTVFAGFNIASKFLGKQFGQFEEWFGQATTRLFGKPSHGEGVEALRAEQSRMADMVKSLEQSHGVKDPAFRGAERELETVAGQLKKLESKPYAFGKILSLDIFATIAAVTLLYTTSKFVSKKNDEKKHPLQSDTVQAAREPIRPPEQSLTDTPRTVIAADTVSDRVSPETREPVKPVASHADMIAAQKAAPAEATLTA